MSENQGKQQSVGALWKKKAQKSGQTYLSGYVEFGEGNEKKKIQIVGFMNKPKDGEKENTNQPAIRIYEKVEFAKDSKPQDDVDFL